MFFLICDPELITLSRFDYLQYLNATPGLPNPYQMFRNNSSPFVLAWRAVKNGLALKMEIYHFHGIKYACFVDWNWKSSKLINGLSVFFLPPCSRHLSHYKFLHNENLYNDTQFSVSSSIILLLRLGCRDWERFNV